MNSTAGNFVDASPQVFLIAAQKRIGICFYFSPLLETNVYSLSCHHLECIFGQCDCAACCRRIPGERDTDTCIVRDFWSGIPVFRAVFFFTDIHCVCVRERKINSSAKRMVLLLSIIAAAELLVNGSFLQPVVLRICWTI